MDLLAFILALRADGKTSSEIRAAVLEYLEDNPEALDQAAVEAILDGRLDDIVLAQQNQPIEEDNRIWFPTGEGETVQVPTYQEYSDLKSALDEIREQTRNLNTADVGRYTVNYNTGAITHHDAATTNFGISEPVKISPETQYTITTYGMSADGGMCALYVAYYDASKAFLSCDIYNNSVISNGKLIKTVTSPQNAEYIAFSTYKSNTVLNNPKAQIEAGSASTEYVQPYTAYDLTARAEIGEAEADLSKTDERISAVTTSVTVPEYEVTTTSLTNATGTMPANGVIDSTNTNYQHSQKIAVQPGDIVTPVSSVSGAYFRMVCAFNGNTVVSGSGTNSGGTEFLVPNGIDGIVVTTGVSYNVAAVNIQRQTGSHKNVYLKQQPLGKFNWSGNLSDGDSVELISSNVRFNVVWNFTGHITTMGKITIGNKDAEGTVTELLSVDATNVYYKAKSGDITTPHGLSISGDLSVRVECDMRMNYVKSITVSSLGEKFVIDGESNIPENDFPCSREMYGSPYLVSDGAVMTECAFSWVPQDIDKPIWVFGDSWVSMYESRWPYYMDEAGYTNAWMLNGFAGEKTKAGLVSFKNLFSIRKPDYLVWMYGMNDGDSSSAVSSTWKSAYDEVVQICEDYDITLILYTVPNTPTINNNYKNAIVRASGYRYIDGVAAVGDDGNGNWFTGYEQSSTDHNHTSVKGAYALFMRILTDFPEIAGNGI